MRKKLITVMLAAAGLASVAVLVSGCDQTNVKRCRLMADENRQMKKETEQLKKELGQRDQEIKNQKEQLYEETLINWLKDEKLSAFLPELLWQAGPSGYRP